MHRSVIVVALVVLFSNSLLGLVRATSVESTPVPASLPAVEAPFGLGTVPLPGTRSGVLALFARLPHAVDGEKQQAMYERMDNRVIASYGEPESTFGPPLTLQALNFEEGDFFPEDITAGTYIASAAKHGDEGTMAFGRDGDVVWLRAETTAGVAGDDQRTPEVTRPLYYVAWGEVDSSWLFTAAASTSEGLDSLASTFVATAASTTPVADC